VNGAHRDVDGLVLREVRGMLEERGTAHDEPAAADALEADLGLSSLDVIRLVAKVASALGVDPLARAGAITDIRTVDDLCRLSRGLVAGEASEKGEIDALRARRAEARERRARRIGSS
jgi:acyl carrier protein